MKAIKRLLSAVFIFCLLLGIMPAAQAADDNRFKDKTWDEVMDDFFDSHNTEYATVTLGYYNLVTGEEHYLNPDVYMVAASTYKVPLNMIFAEKISKGEMTLDSPIGSVEYSYLLHTTIVDSNNEHSAVLWTKLGSYNNFRHQIVEYMGETEETIDPQFFVNNYNTARQSVACLKLLYENPERFPYVLDTMKEAEPERYFRMKEHRYEIAHKYGFNKEEYHIYVNDTGIVFTEDPFVIAFYSDNLGMAADVMADYCTLMCDYTEYHTALRHEQEAEEAAAAQAAEEQAKAEAEALAKAAAAEAATEPTKTAKEESSMSFSTIIMYILAVVVTVAAIVLVISHHKKVGIFWGLIAALLTGSALFVCIFGSSVGTLITVTEGNPTDSVTGFFDAVTLGDYGSAYDYLQGYSSLGLEEEPSTEAAAMLHHALQQSYSYTLSGPAAVDGINATQQVDFTYLDLSAVDVKIQAVIQDKLKDIVAKHSRSEIYDENDNYRPEITSEAYLNALSEALSDAENCYTTASLTMKLDYINEQWLITPDQTLFRALFGGIA